MFSKAGRPDFQAAAFFDFAARFTSAHDVGTPRS